MSDFHGGIYTVLKSNQNHFFLWQNSGLSNQAINQADLSQKLLQCWNQPKLLGFHGGFNYNTKINLKIPGFQGDVYNY